MGRGWRMGIWESADAMRPEPVECSESEAAEGPMLAVWEGLRELAVLEAMVGARQFKCL